ncbi:MAG: hypothetical protein WD845_17780 [Pirellulales bacterium]
MLSLLLSLGMLLAADEPAADAALATQVAQLVRQLDSRELSARNDAERSLLELGAAALPLLPVINDDTPAEIALRVTRVQQKLLEARVAAAAEPTRITLVGENLPLADVLAEFEKQTGNSIVDYRENFGQEKTDVAVTVDFDKVPFWKALDQVLDQAGLTLYPYSGNSGAYVVNRTSDSGSRAEGAFYAGIFRLEPMRFEAVRDLRGGDMQALRLYLEVTWEPRLQPFAILQDLAQVSAEGDGGQALAVASQGAMPEATIRTGMSTAELEIPLQLPDRTMTKIRKLQGKLLALVPGPAEDFRFASPPVAERNTPPKRLEQRKAGATVTIDRVRKNNAAWEVALRVKFDNPSTALESHRGWILDNDVYFVDAAGRQATPGGFEQSRQGKDEVGINYYFDLAESPDKLDFVYRTPTTILEMAVDYELHDLPLP